MRRDFPIHADLQCILDDECFGELREETIVSPGRPTYVYYVCEECGKELSASEVLNHDRDTNDWEFDMRYEGSY